MTRTHAIHRHLRSWRRGFTLIELLVVMAIITALGLLALMLLPGIGNSDAALKATEEVRAQCKIAQALAGGARQPRGVRFLVPATAPPGNRFATELQLLESPPVTVLDPLTLVATGSNPTGVNGPHVDLLYEMYNGTSSDPSIDPRDAGASPPVIPPAGAIKTRHCYIRGLTADQRSQVVPTALLYLPTLGAWSRVSSVIGMTVAGTPAADPDEVVLEVYPDQLLGASTAFRTYHAGIYGPPIPLLGQPTIPLPQDVGVDLDISSPPVQVPASGLVPNYDILFAPDGQTILVGGRLSNSAAYMWVRDITKKTNPSGANITSMRRLDFPLTPVGDALWQDAFRLGGEQHVVGIANGYVGTAPIQWPPPGTVNGVYPPGTGDPFTFARKRLN